MSNHPPRRMCGNCYYYETPQQIVVGQPGTCCHAPPQAAMVPVVEQPVAGVQRQGWQIVTYYPQPSRTSWCGKWRPADAGEVALPADAAAAGALPAQD